jgi:hypothetical protein
VHHPELLRYHPNRYAASRDFFDTLYNYYRGLDPLEGVLSSAEIKQLFTTYAEAFWNPHLLETPLPQRPRNTKRMSEEFALFCHVARFKRFGKNIFHFSPTLVQLLKLTDVEGVQWASIHFPYGCLYAYFGPQAGWQLGDSDHPVDGAYLGEVLSAGVRAFEVMLTTGRGAVADVTPWNYVLQEDRYYYFPFEVRSAEATVGDTFRVTVATDDDFNKDWAPPKVPPEARSLAGEAGINLASLPPERTAQGQAIRERLEWMPVFREALKLIINCLCYLSSPSREVADTYPDTDLTRRITEAPSPLERARARNQASREGYTLIHFCGGSLERQSRVPSGGRELSAHWRRGHWRNQAFGLGRAQRRLIWIRPTLVRKDKATDGVPGHMYDVGGEGEAAAR